MIKEKLTIGKVTLPLWLWVLPLVLVSVGILVFALSQPKEASWRYGVCKAFLQSYVRFPSTIDIKVGGESRRGQAACRDRGGDQGKSCRDKLWWGKSCGMFHRSRPPR